MAMDVTNAKWDTLYNRIMTAGIFKNSEKLRFKALKFLETIHDKNANICDIGCGNGRTLNHLHEFGYQNLYALDIENQLAESVNSFVTFIPGRIDMSINEIDDEYFDAIYVFETLHHLETIDAMKLAFLEMQRMLRKGGYLFYYEPGNNILRKLHDGIIGLSILHCIPLIKSLNDCIEMEKKELTMFINNLHQITPFHQEIGMKVVLDKNYLHHHIWCFQK